MISLEYAFTLNSVFDSALQELLSRLESIPERREQTQTELDNVNPENNVLIGQEERWQPQTGLDQAMIREFLSARDLKTVRNDSASKRSSGCFGRRLDRIGSMSSLGCNTVGRFSTFYLYLWCFWMCWCAFWFQEIITFIDSWVFILCFLYLQIQRGDDVLPAIQGPATLLHAKADCIHRLFIKVYLFKYVNRLYLFELMWD